MVEVKVKKLHDDAVMPVKGSEEAAGYDLVAVSDPKKSMDACGPILTFNTGLSLEIPKGYAGYLFPRSSIATKTSYGLANSVGVIDSDYRGEVLVKFRDYSVFRSHTQYKKGDKICQLIIMPVPSVDFVEVKEKLTETDRGEGGFGSTDNG